MSIDVLLSRLESVRQLRPGNWRAICPAHDDRHPSLDIKLSDDGLILLKCRVGCDNAAVVAAIGLDLSDLFPPRPTSHFRGPVPFEDRNTITMRDLLALMERHVLRVAVAAESLAQGMALTSADLESLRNSAAVLMGIVRAHA